MVTDSKGRPVTLDSLNSQLFRLERGTPIPEVTDYRIAAGFLVTRYGDRTRRFINLEDKLKPVIVIEWIRKMTVARRELIPTTPEVVARLRSEHLVRGTPQMGYTDMNRLEMDFGTGLAVARQHFSSGHH